MEYPSTPKMQPQAYTSSVFMTPADLSGEGKSVTLPPGPLPHILPPFPTPDDTPSPERHKYKPKLSLCGGEDVLSALHMGGYRMLVKTILFYLEPSDLASCVLVCDKWNQIVSSFSQLQGRIQVYKKQKQIDIENMHKSLSPVCLRLDRKPLGDARNRLARKATSSTPTLPIPPPSLPKRVMYKHRLCPRCKAPAKQLNLRRAECIKCRYDYCSACLKAWHDNRECERLRSPKRITHENSVGTKRSKKNLKRC